MVFKSCSRKKKANREDTVSRRPKWKVNFYWMGTCSSFTSLYFLYLVRVAKKGDIRKS